MDELTAGEMPQAVGGRKRASLFGKRAGREEESPPDAAAHAIDPAAAETTPPRDRAPSGSEDFALKPDPAAMPRRMSVPPDVEITGTLSSRSETYIAGTVDGNVTVESSLSLAKGSKITGKIKATQCRLDGQVDGGVDCTDDFEVGDTGVLNADAVSGNQMSIAGEINGGLHCGGRLHLLPTARVSGDIRARSVIVEEGAIYNGTCSMTSKKKK